MSNLTFANRWNAELIDQNYQQWLEDPESVDAQWRIFFEGFELARELRRDADGEWTDEAPATTTDAVSTPDVPVQVVSGADPVKQARFTGAIYAFRSIGHTQANFNPLNVTPPENPRLSLHRLGFTESDLQSVYNTGNYLGGRQMTVADLLDNLKQTYCGSIGVEYLHIQETRKRRWLQSRMEPTLNNPSYSREQRHRFLEHVLEAETFEKFLHSRYIGQKRFGIEGGETLIAALDALIERCPVHDIGEVVMGMAHRGRLNVLANILGKSVEFILHEFSENFVPDTIHGDGDVKYHLGFDAERPTSHARSVGVRLAANPSHLEAVNPVVEGRVRARQRIAGDVERKKVLPVLIHGDAAFSGQGMVAEVLNLSQLKGYTTGGTIHFIVNNQIGFTTNPEESRSSLYCTDIGKMIEAPIFHVNGDDPEAMVYVTEMALDYRQEFSEDVIIDMYCYRRHGHNESDEPAFTQPTLYRKIANHPLISESYSNRLRDEGDLTTDEMEELRSRYHDRLEDAFEAVKKSQNGDTQRTLSESTATFQPPYSFRPVKTSVREENLDRVAHALTTMPEDFEMNRKIQRFVDQRAKAWESGEGIDWAFAESLAWGTLMMEGTPIRLSGQDSERGTFSQRHAAFYETETRRRHVPLLNIEGCDGWFCVHNSLLSEAAVLGFDYGYSLDFPQMLVMWEAQFGDFGNGAQVIIDQFLSSSESKWQRVSGLVMLLPHGYEGQGPEHSSARLERFLQLCAEDNLQVANFTTPAQYFHALRRQMKRDFRKPLILMAPKSLLRHKECVSSKEDLTKGRFHELIDDPEPPESAKRIVFCCGKVYYDLLDYRRENEIDDTALVRVEQLYPLHREEMRRILANHSDAKLVWCQEEPQNMGAWSYLAPHLEELAGHKPFYAGRDAGASPAVGSLALHKIEQNALVEMAFRG